MRPLKLLALVLIGSCLACAPLSAQFVWDHDTDWRSVNSRQHVLAGAGIDATMGLIGWPKRWYERVAMTAAIGAAYEFGQESDVHDDPTKRAPGYGFGPMDLGLDIGGAVLREGHGYLWKHSHNTLQRAALNMGTSWLVGAYTERHWFTTATYVDLSWLGTIGYDWARKKLR